MHTVEVWEGSELVGGLDGLALGAVFFGEIEMFHRRTDASKVALAHLVERLNFGGFRLLYTAELRDAPSRNAWRHRNSAFEL